MDDGDPWGGSTTADAEEAGQRIPTSSANAAPSTSQKLHDAGDPWSSRGPLGGSPSGTGITTPAEMMSMDALNAALPLPKRRPSVDADPWGEANVNTTESVPGLDPVTSNFNMAASMTMPSAAPPSMDMPTTSSWAPDENLRLWGSPETSMQPFGKPADEDFSEVDFSSAATPTTPSLADIGNTDSHSTPYTFDLPSSPPATDAYAIDHSSLPISEHPSNSPTVRPVISPLPTRINLNSPVLDEEAPDSDEGGFGGFSNGLSVGATGAASGAEDSFGSWGGEEDGWDKSMDLGMGEPALPSWDNQGSQETIGASGGFDREGERDAGWYAAATTQDHTGFIASNSEQSAQGSTDDWEAAQAEAERREARAPVGKIRELEEAWKKVLDDVVATLSANEINDFDGGDGPPLVGSAMNNASSTLDSLSDLPPSATAFLTPYNSSVTREVYLSWLSQATLTPHNSLLARVVQDSSRINARRRSLDVEEWTARSKLGEPEDRLAATSNKDQSARPGWSFWRRQAPDPNIPLTTSGGGVLEIKKAEPPSSTSPSLSKASPTLSSQQPVVSISNLPPTTRGPISPNGSMGSQSSTTTAAHASNVSQTATGAPGGGGFFSRFRRNRAESPVEGPSVDLNTNKDVELSTNDLSFLSEVPSLPNNARPQHSPGFGDLLGFDGGSDGLTKAAPALPDLLTSKPPPRQPMSRGPRSISLIASTSNAGTPPPRKRSPFADFDGLADLDFSPTGTPQAETPHSQMVSSQETHTFTSLASNTPPLQHFGQAKSSPSFFPSGFSLDAPPRKSSPPPVAFMNNPLPPPAASRPHAHPQTNDSSFLDDEDGFGDFGDFAQTSAPNPATSSSTKTSVSPMDFSGLGAFSMSASNPKQSISVQPTQTSSYDFADFSAFDAIPSSKPAAQPAPNQLTAPAAKLVNDAANHTGRWPAPASPIPDLLPPPPRNNALPTRSSTKPTNFFDFDM